MSISHKEPTEHLSHWYRLFDGMKHSPQAFYDVIEARIKEQQLPDTNFGRVTFRERGLLSSRREYLRVMRGEMVFDICAAPFGKDAFFVSYWLGQIQAGGCSVGLLAAVPFIGSFVEKSIQPLTYFELDSALMFQETIHSIILAHVDELTAASGIDPIPEHERKPTMKKLANL